MKIVVASSDNGQDLFDYYHHCIEKYWPKHPEVIYSTESVKNPYYKTIHKKVPLDKWTKRIRETVKKVDDEYILLMCDDIFIREPVDDNLINGLTKYFDDNTAAINFENHFDAKDISVDKIVKRRHNNGAYKTSMMFQLWKKDKLLSVLEGIDVDPWAFEKMNNHKGYTYYVNANGHKGLINFGKVDNIYNWGIVKGKWTLEAIKFFRKEGLDVNYGPRGVVHEAFKKQ